MAKILLIQPPITKQERYSSAIGSAGGNQIPLGIFYLAAYLRRYGYSADVTDAEANDLTADQIVDQIRRNRYDLIGISSTTVAFHRAVEVAGAIKKHWPDLPIVIGGPHVSSQPEHAISFDEFDFAVRNEGEETCVELIRSLLSDKEYEKIRGLVFKQNGQIIVNPPRPLIKNIDDIPFPAYDLITEMSRYAPPPSNYKKKPVANIITSRGCPNQCTFCDNNTFGRTVRHRSPENIAEEIKLLMRKYGVREIAFVDDTATLSKKRIYDLFDYLALQGLTFPWTCMARVDTVDEKLLKFMKKNGCWHVSFGIESGNENILKTIRKNIKLDQVENAVNICHSLGILTKGFFILGHPGETVETMDQTLEFARKLKLDDIVVTINTPIPGTFQYDHVREYGHLDSSRWDKFNYWNPVFVPYGLTQQQISEKHKQFYRKFYMRPKILWRYFLSFFSLAGPKRLYLLLKASLFLVRKDRKTPMPLAGESAVNTAL